MRAIIQRVSEARVAINGEVKSAIEQGLLVFVGIEKEDGIDDAQWLARKIASLRIFSDSAGLMNLSLADIKGKILVISQFTLHAKTKKGTRPSFIHAAKPELAVPLYEKFITLLSSEVSTEVQSGTFGADMQVSLINDGPVTISIDTKNKE